MTDSECIKTLLDQLSIFFQKEGMDRFCIEGTDKAEAGDRVTQIDLQSQQMIISQIKEVFPDDAIFAEESGFDTPPSNPLSRCWIIDPLDGTYNFQRTLCPAYAVSIALTVNGEPIAAGVLLPELMMQFTAEKGKGAFCNGERLSVSKISDLGEAKVDVDFSELSRRKECMSVAKELMLQASQVRSTGSTVVALCSIALGLTELFIHPCPQPWDYAAGMLLIEEAGGTLSRFNCDPINLLDGQTELIASNGLIGWSPKT